MSSKGGGGRVGALPRYACAAISLGPILWACGPAEPGESADTTIEASGANAAGPGSPSPAPPTGTSMPNSADSLRLRVEAPARVAAGEPVRLTLRASNTTERALTLYLTGRSIAFDLIVEDTSGSVIWRRLEGEVVQAILRLETLPPGEALVLEHAWDQRNAGGERVPPGAYSVRGELLTEDGPLTSSAAPLRILPP